MYENIIKNVKRFISLSEEEEKIFTDYLTLQTFPKKNGTAERRRNLSV
ncbi:MULTISPECIES: hypothetical protein [unclassified Chryseobacterium]|nr:MULTISPECIES: hypothetical protein [unclassified Chryseobacterium]